MLQWGKCSTVNSIGTLQYPIAFSRAIYQYYVTTGGSTNPFNVYVGGYNFDRTNLTSGKFVCNLSNYNGVGVSVLVIGN